jgi:branched-chain amino acid transport system permease protein
VLGFIEVLLQAWLPDAALPFKDAVALVIVIAILLWRPQGLLGKATDRV